MYLPNGLPSLVRHFDKSTAIQQCICEKWGRLQLIKHPRDTIWRSLFSVHFAVYFPMASSVLTAQHPTWASHSLRCSHGRSGVVRCRSPGPSPAVGGSGASGPPAEGAVVRGERGAGRGWWDGAGGKDGAGIWDTTVHEANRLFMNTPLPFGLESDFIPGGVISQQST